MGKYIIVLLILLGLILIFSAPMRVKFYYNREAKNNIFNININIFWGLIKFQISEPDSLLNNSLLRPVIKLKAKLGPPQSENKNQKKEKVTYKFTLDELVGIFRRINKLVVRYDNAIRYILGSTRVYDFSWQTSYGFQDPAYTGMSFGLFWSIKSIIYNYLQGKVKEVVGAPKFYIQPNFFGAGFSTRINCIFALRLGHIIIASLKILVSRIFKRG